MYMDNQHQAGLSTQKAAALGGAAIQSLVHSSWPSSANRRCLTYSYVPKESPDDSCESSTEVLLMALTFGTLLSSQGADAHRRNRFRLFGGNPRNATPVRAPGSNPSRPASHLVAAHRVEARPRRRVALGGCSLRLPRGLRAANKENISQPHPAASNPLGRCTGCPCLLGSSTPDTRPQIS